MTSSLRTGSARRSDRDTSADGGGVHPLRWLDRPLASYYLVLGSAGMLVAIGLVMVLSASSVSSYVATGSSYGVFRTQAVWVGLGLVALWFGLMLPEKAYRALAYPLLIGSTVLLLAVLVPHVGVTVDGSTRWLDLGPIRLQPSELAKLGLALWGADLLARKRRLVVQPRHLLIPLVPGALLLTALVMAEPDLGTTLCIVLVVFGLLFFVGAPLRVLGWLGGTMVFLVVVLIAVEPYRMARVTSFVDPFSDAQNSGYQAVQGIYSLASGGWWGAGLGASTGKWTVPNAYTDYIFAIIGGDLGLMGCLLVLAIFSVFAYAGIRVARRSSSTFVQLASGAVTVWLTGQAVINIGYVIGLLPVTGIPLPLISFGGTSLVLTMFVVGMLASFARQEPAAAAAIAQRGPTRVSRLLRLPVPPLPEAVVRPVRPAGRRSDLRGRPADTEGRGRQPDIRGRGRQADSGGRGRQSDSGGRGRPGPARTRRDLS